MLKYRGRVKFYYAREYFIKFLGSQYSPFSAWFIHFIMSYFCICFGSIYLLNRSSQITIDANLAIGYIKGPKSVHCLFLIHLVKGNVIVIMQNCVLSFVCVCVCVCVVLIIFFCKLQFFSFLSFFLSFFWNQNLRLPIWKKGVYLTYFSHFFTGKKHENSFGTFLTYIHTHILLTYRLALFSQFFKNYEFIMHGFSLVWLQVLIRISIILEQSINNIMITSISSLLLKHNPFGSP